MYRPSIDVTQAELVPHLNWRQQERTVVVGNWKAKIYDMLHVMVSVKSRRVPGAMTDEELFSVDDDERTGNGGEYDDDVLTTEERMQLDSALRMGNSDVLCEDEDRGVQDCHENGDSGSYESAELKEKKSWFGWNKKGSNGVVMTVGEVVGKMVDGEIVRCVGEMMVGEMGGPSTTKVEEKKTEKTTFDVKLEKFNVAAKIKVIKEVRAFTNIGLKEAKDLVEKTSILLGQEVKKRRQTT
ncbi:hypothetical protein ACSBR2_004091 [Camellia fascicularis]